MRRPLSPIVAEMVIGRLFSSLEGISESKISFKTKYGPVHQYTASRSQMTTLHPRSCTEHSNTYLYWRVPYKPGTKPLLRRRNTPIRISSPHSHIQSSFICPLVLQLPETPIHLFLFYSSCNRITYKSASTHSLQKHNLSLSASCFHFNASGNDTTKNYPFPQQPPQEID